MLVFERLGIVRGGDKKRAGNAAVDDEGAAHVVMEAPAVQHLVIAAMPPARRSVKMKAVDGTVLRYDAIKHGVGLAVFALIMVEEALRREAARDVSQLLGRSNK